jgi:hypothetical protein
MTASLVLSLLALLLASAALAAVLAAALGERRRRTEALESPLPTDVTGLRDEVERLRRTASGALRQPVIVRYDAFGDMGGRMSWSMALVDQAGNGVVLTSIHGRSDARSYAKALQDWLAEQPLSPEEEKAVAAAREQ